MTASIFGSHAATTAAPLFVISRQRMATKNNKKE
jgi:hypothetical protein